MMRVEMIGDCTLYHADCREVLRELPDNSIDSCVTDPPYGLNFMGRAWDAPDGAPFAAEFWREVLRVLKPGGHVVAASGTRTYHRLACAVEDAGFEIRDMVIWLYGSGFPKSHDVSKGMAKRRTEDVAPIRVVCRYLRRAMDHRGLKSRDLTQHFGDCNARLIDHWAARDSDSQPALPTPDQWLTLVGVLELSNDDDFPNIVAEVERLNLRKGSHGARWAEAEVIGEVASTPAGFGELRFNGDTTIRLLDEEAAAWEGWGTALKPACEPWALARKPLIGTVAANVLAHGTGALNIDGCRVGIDDDERKVIDARSGAGFGTIQCEHAGRAEGERFTSHTAGRWPANVVHDGSDEVVGALGEPSRFFYAAKASKHDRAGSSHPTVKPVSLMRWLTRLVTPPGGMVLDPFAGSGTTGEACRLERFRCVLVEREDEYVDDIRRRLESAIFKPVQEKML